MLRRLPPLLLVGLCVACAPAVPVLGGGTPTPHRRADLAVGGASRVLLGDLRESASSGEREALVEDAQPGGITPVAAIRYGLGEHLDLGLMVAGPLVRPELRYEVVLAPGTTRTALVFGLAPYAGAIHGTEDDEGGLRMGVDMPLLFGASFGSVVETWAGLRFGAESLGADLRYAADLQAVSAWGLRAGAVVGLATGFRHVHALLELTAAFENWRFDGYGDHDIGASGIVLTPAFALRLRL